MKGYPPFMTISNNLQRRYEMRDTIQHYCNDSQYIDQGMINHMDDPVIREYKRMFGELPAPSSTPYIPPQLTLEQRQLLNLKNDMKGLLNEYGHMDMDGQCVYLSFNLLPDIEQRDLLMKYCYCYHDNLWGDSDYQSIKEEFSGVIQDMLNDYGDEVFTDFMEESGGVSVMDKINGERLWR